MSVDVHTMMSVAEAGAASDEKRLLREVAMIGDLLHEEAETAEIATQLSCTVVDALRDAGLWRMRLSRELGGLELPMLSQLRIIAELAALDPSSAWCTMFVNTAIARIGAIMPDAAVSRVFADGVPAASIVIPPGGIATPTDGGYLITGHWRYATAIHHVDWLLTSVRIERDPSRLLPVVIPAGDLHQLDSWDPTGLRATGSIDLTLENYFLPDELTGRLSAPFEQIRGARRYESTRISFPESFEHAAFACGVARRAIAELRKLLADRELSAGKGGREVVLTQFAEAEVELQAVWALIEQTSKKIDAVHEGSSHAWDEADRLLPRVIAARATKLALHCTQIALERAGLSAMRRGEVLERLARDMTVAASHIAVNDAAFAAYAQHLVETQSFVNRFGDATAEI